MMSQLVSSGCGYIDYHRAVDKFGSKKVAKMIDNGILYLHPISKLQGMSEKTQSKNVVMSTGPRR